jgi:hypothetical protein
VELKEDNEGARFISLPKGEKPHKLRQWIRIGIHLFFDLKIRLRSPKDRRPFKTREVRRRLEHG